MARKVTIEVDLDELPTMIRQSAQTCLAAHGIQFMERGRLLSAEETAARMRELGNNVAQLVACLSDE